MPFYHERQNEGNKLDKSKDNLIWLFWHLVRNIGRKRRDRCITYIDKTGGTGTYTETKTEK